MTEHPTPLTLCSVLIFEHLGEHLAARQLRLLEWAKGKGAVEIFCPLVPKRGLEGGNKSVKLPVAESRWKNPHRHNAFSMCSSKECWEMGAR